jgi:hypothetical protein
MSKTLALVLVIAITFSHAFVDLGETKWLRPLAFHGIGS